MASACIPGVHGMGAVFDGFFFVWVGEKVEVDLLSACTAPAHNTLGKARAHTYTDMIGHVFVSNRTPKSVHVRILSHAGTRRGIHCSLQHIHTTSSQRTTSTLKTRSKQCVHTSAHTWDPCYRECRKSRGALAPSTGVGEKGEAHPNNGITQNTPDRQADTQTETAWHAATTYVKLGGKVSLNGKV